MSFSKVYTILMSRIEQLTELFVELVKIYS